MHMEVQATTKFIRVSPRKLALLVKNMRGMKAQQVVTNLTFTRKAGVTEIRKLILSAIANAKQKNINQDQLMVKSLNVLPGGAMKRFRAVSRGMAHTYKKRMSHVRVTLTDIEEKAKNTDHKSIKSQKSETPNLSVKDNNKKESIKEKSEKKLK